MMARLLGAAACVLALLAGGAWWGCLGGFALFMLPGRLAPLAATILLLVPLPFGIGAPWADLALVATGMAAAAACMVRLGGAVPWVALPWFGAGAALLILLAPILPPAGFWDGADISVRARILVLAAIALVGSAVTYLPRYHAADDAGEGEAPE